MSAANLRRAAPKYRMLFGPAKRHTYAVVPNPDHEDPSQSIMHIYAFISPDKLATLLLLLLSSKGFSPGRETAARAVAISSMLKISELSSQYV